MKKSILAVVGVALAATLAIVLARTLAAPAAPPAHGDAKNPMQSAAVSPQPGNAPAESPRSEVAAEGSHAVGEAAASTATVHGRVVDGDGKPLAGALVVIGDKAHWMFRDAHSFLSASIYSRFEAELAEAAAATQRTPTSGEFSLPPPSNARPHLLVAWLPERGGRAVDVPSELGKAIEFVLPQDAIVTGVVRNRVDQRPIAGVEIHVWPAASGYPVSWRHTDAEGRYTLQRLPPGDYRMKAEHAAFADGAATFALVQRQLEHQLDLELAPLPAFHAQLVDAAGAPWNRQRIGAAIDGEPGQLSAVLSLARVARRGEFEAMLRRHHAIQLDDDGWLRGHVQNADWRVLTIWRGDEKLFEVPAVDFAAQRITTELLPRPMVELQVRLRFEPVPTTVPTVELAIVDPSGLRQDPAPIVTKRTNEAVCGLLVPADFGGRACGLSVRAADLAPFYAVLQIPEGVTQTWHEVVLSPADCTVRGVIVAPNGKPAYKAHLCLVDADGHQFLPRNLSCCAARSDGTFEFVGVPRRRARLLVAAEDLGARAVAIDTATALDLRIELRDPRRVHVSLPDSIEGAQFRVLDAAGLPFADDRVSGAIHHGGGTLLVDPEAASIEVYEPVTGGLLASRLVPADGKLVLAPVSPATKR